MMKKVKILGIILLLLIIIGIIVFFCLDGYNKIEDWFMTNNEIENNEIHNNENSNIGETKDYSSVDLENLPKNYSKLEAANDGCFVIVNKEEIYNKDKLDEFFLNTYQQSFVSAYGKSTIKKDSSIRIVEYKNEDAIITDIEYSLQEDTYTVKIDNTRNKSIEERKIETKKNLPGEYLTFMIVEESEEFILYLALYNGERELYDDILVASFSKKVILKDVNLVFYGEITSVTKNSIMVNVSEGQELRKTIDKINVYILEGDNTEYKEGMKVKVKSKDSISLSNPPQVSSIKIDIIEDFDLIFNQSSKIEENKIIDKSKVDEYDYDIYIYGGELKVYINGEVKDFKEAVLNKTITIEQVIKKANKDIKDGRIYGGAFSDGGSVMYRYSNYTIIKYNTLELEGNGNRDLYIGNIGMDMKVSKK